MTVVQTKKKRVRATSRDGPSVEAVLKSLERLGTRRTRDSLARYGIQAHHAFGVAMGDIHKLAKSLGVDHDLAAGLWKTGCYEARLLAPFVDDPARVTPAQMDRWCRDFDNWAVCDTVCFKLFDRTPHALAKVAEWSTRRGEFQKRGAFALLASIALHDKKVGDERLLAFLPLIEAAARDERNFVKKGVSWALRAIGRRPTLNAPATAVAQRLAGAGDTSSRWVGRDALRELTRRR